MPRITLALLDHQPDLVVLSEFRTTIGGQIAGVLADVGLMHQRTTASEPGVNGLLIASRWPLSRVDEPDAPDARRWLACHIETLSLTLAAVHIPDGSSPTPRAAFWRDTIAIAGRWCRDAARARTLFVGDFNSGRHGLDEAGKTFGHTSRLGELATLGYRDVYRDLHPRGREYSWFSRAGNGFRLDGAWASPPLAAEVPSIEYVQSDRENRVSDHAMLKIRMEIAGF